MSKTTATTAAKASSAAPKPEAESKAKPVATNTPNDDVSSAANAGTGAEAVAGAGPSEGAVSADGQGDQGTAQTIGGDSSSAGGEAEGAHSADAQSRQGAALDTNAAPGQQNAGGTPAWEVLSPFKFQGNVIKPPAWLELDEEEAKPYQAAGVLGTEPGEVSDDE